MSVHELRRQLVGLPGVKYLGTQWANFESCWSYIFSGNSKPVACSCVYESRGALEAGVWPIIPGSGSQKMCLTQHKSPAAGKVPGQEDKYCHGMAKNASNHLLAQGRLFGKFRKR